MRPEKRKECFMCQDWDGKTCKFADARAKKWGLFCGSVCGDYCSVKTCDYNQACDDWEQYHNAVIAEKDAKIRELEAVIDGLPDVDEIDNLLLRVVCINEYFTDDFKQKCAEYPVFSRVLAKAIAERIDTAEGVGE